MKRLGTSNGKDSVIKESSFLYLIVGVFLLIFLLSCKPKDSGNNGLHSDSLKTNLTNTTGEKNYVLAKVNDLRIREQPSSKSAVVLAKIYENSYWPYTGKKSEKTEKITLRDKEYDEYWYKIKIKDCVEGWVYGGAVEFIEKPDEKIQPNIPPLIYFKPDLVELLTKDKTTKVTAILEAFNKIKTAKDLVAFYTTKTAELGALLSYDEMSNNTDDLNCVFQIFECTQLCSECELELYTKHSAFLDKAKQSPEKIDDALFQLLLDAMGEVNAFSGGNLSVHDCDFCWHKNFGNGKILELIKRLNAFWEEVDKKAIDEALVKPILENLESFLILEMDGTTYMNSKEQVLKEYNDVAKIFKGRALGNRMSDFKNLKKKLETDADLTFDCQEKDCSSIVMEKMFPSEGK